MCGIAGIIYRDGEHDIGLDMTAMLQSMKHRGPDSTGYALYHRPTTDVVMRCKLADSNDVRDFGFSERLERNRREIEDLIANYPVDLPGLRTIEVPLSNPGAARDAAVEAVGANGQTSWQVLGLQPQPVFTYAAAQFPSIQVSPGFLTAGTSAMVRIDGTFTNFSDGRTAVGFGSSDITVSQMWVLGPASILMNVTVSPNAQPGLVQVTVAV